MDLTVIRVKRTRDSEAVDLIGLSSKKFKNDDGTARIPMVATLESKDESLKDLVQKAVSKLKLDKLNRQRGKGCSSGYESQYKLHPTKGRGERALRTALKQQQTAVHQRYQIVNKARGIAPSLDPETLSYLSKSELISLKFETTAAASSSEDTTAASGSSSSCGGDNGAEQQMQMEVVDVNHSSVAATIGQEQTICVNGVPMEHRDQTDFVYDVYLATIPRGYSCSDYIIDLPPGYDQDLRHYSDDEDDCSDASDDSNAENNYRNDYPDEEQDDEESEEESKNEEEFVAGDNLTAVGREQYWDYDDMSKLMQLISLDDSKAKAFLRGKNPPSHIRSLVDWTKRNGDSDEDEDDDDSEQSLEEDDEDYIQSDKSNADSTDNDHECMDD